MGRKGALLRLFEREWRVGRFARGNGRSGGGEGGVGATSTRHRRVKPFGLLGEGFGDRVVVDGQIGQGVEDVPLTNDRVD